MKTSYKFLLAGLLSSLVCATSFADVQKVDSKAIAGLEVVKMSDKELATTEGKGPVCLINVCQLKLVSTRSSCNNWSNSCSTGGYVFR